MGDLIVLSDISIKDGEVYSARLREGANPLAVSFVSWFLGRVGTQSDTAGSDEA
ncbi:hypothetical protein [Roseibium sp. M-1]